MARWSNEGRAGFELVPRIACDEPDAIAAYREFFTAVQARLISPAFQFVRVETHRDGLQLPWWSPTETSFLPSDPLVFGTFEIDLHSVHAGVVEMMAAMAHEFFGDRVLWWCDSDNHWPKWPSDRKQEESEEEHLEEAETIDYEREYRKNQPRWSPPQREPRLTISDEEDEAVLDQDLTWLRTQARKRQRALARTPPTLPPMPHDQLPLYLDYNATTPLSEAVVAAMQPFLKAGVGSTLFGNPSSSHIYGTSSKAALDLARVQVATCIGAEDAVQNIIFTSGATESLNLAIIGGARRQRALGRGNHIITSNIEHIAVLKILEYLEVNEDFTVTLLPVDQYGHVSPEQVAAAITPETVFITLMLANNEVGSVMPIREIVRAVRRTEVKDGSTIWVHTDASQAIGKLIGGVRVHTGALGVDLLTLAGHKMYAPKGVGALYVRHSTVGACGGVEKLMHGANHELNRRAGTENVMYAVGLGAACDELMLTGDRGREQAKRLRELRDRLFGSIDEHLYKCRQLQRLFNLTLSDVTEDEVEPNGPAASTQEHAGANVIVRNSRPTHRSAHITQVLEDHLPSVLAPLICAYDANARPAQYRYVVHQHHDQDRVDHLVNTLSIGFHGILADELLHRLRHHLAASAGAACHSDMVTMSYVLAAMKVAPEYGEGTIRLSVGRYTTEEDVDRAGEWIAIAVTQMWAEQRRERQPLPQSQAQST